MTDEYNLLNFMTFLRNFHARQICKCFVALSKPKFLDLCAQKVDFFGLNHQLKSSSVKSDEILAWCRNF